MTVPKATTNKRLDMTKEPFTPAQRFYLWQTFIIVLGALGAVLGIAYFATHR